MKFLSYESRFKLYGVVGINNPARTKIKDSSQLKTLFLQIHKDLGQGTDSVEWRMLHKGDL